MDAAAVSSAGLVAAAYGGLGATRVKAHSPLAYRDAAFTAKSAASAVPAAAAPATAVPSVVAATGPSEASRAAAATSGATAAATGPSEASRAAACAGDIADHRCRGTDSSGARPGELEADSVSDLS